MSSTTPPLTKPWSTWLTHIRDAFPHHTPKRDWFVQVFEWLEHEGFKLDPNKPASVLYENGYDLFFKNNHAQVEVSLEVLTDQGFRPGIEISDLTESWAVVISVLTPIEQVKKLISLANPEVENHIPQHP